MISKARHDRWAPQPDDWLTPPRPDSSITVADVLRLPELRQGVPEVVAGRGSLSRPVRWVHTGETPRIASLLKGGELLLTTGMGVSQVEGEQRRFIRELCDRRLAALALELGTVFRQMPPALVDEAEQGRLPLIALHREVPFVDITEAVHREVVNRQYALMQRGAEVNERFTDVMLRGAGIPDVLEALAEAIANPVLVEKSGYGVLYHADHGTDGQHALAAWDAAERDLDGACARLESLIVMGGGEPWGRLVALDLETPFDAFTGVALAHAAPLIALTLLRTRQEEALAARERGDFFAQLLGGQLPPHDAQLRAKALGFAPGGDRLAPFVAGTRPSARGAPVDPSLWSLVARDLRGELQRRSVPSLIGLGGEGASLVGILALTPGTTREAAGATLATCLRKRGERHLRTSERFDVCLGATATWAELSAALEDALDALPAVFAAPARDWHDVTRPDLGRLFWSLRSLPALTHFAEQRLAPLVEHDRRRKSALIPTLEAYLACGRRKALAARSLHVERQSLYHRLARIEALLQASLDDEDVALGLAIALRARRGASP